MKKLGKKILCSILERQVRQLRVRNTFTIIAVGGSVGKTSTKLAIAKTLASRSRVRYQNGNYNDRLTVPLVVFGEEEPAIFNIMAWLKLLRRTARASRQPYPYDHVVLELGTDAPGQMKDFAYLNPDIFVLTAIADEHMEYFKTIEVVAAEELVPLSYSRQSLVNTDDTPTKYLKDRSYIGYGLEGNAHYHVSLTAPAELSMRLGGTKLEVHSALLGRQGAKIMLAAAAVAHMLDWSVKDIRTSLQTIAPVAGRLQLLPGLRGSTLLDDTYNASPIAVKAALEVLYAMEAPQRIAILGTMNELGDGSSKAHREIGELCDPNKLAIVITIGKPAEEHLAPAAEARGCKVVSFHSPYDAGAYVKEQLQPGLVVLAKGSQNGVFAEEALKPLLSDPADAAKLVRQSPYWLAQKRRQFPRVSG